MSILAKLKQHARLFVFGFAFIAGAAVVQYLWAVELVQAAKRGPGNPSLPVIHFFAQNIEKLKSLDATEATQSTISIINGKDQLISNLKGVNARHKNDKVSSLINALESLHFPKTRYDTQLREFVHLESGRRFTQEDVIEIKKQVEAVQLARSVLDAEATIINMELHSHVFGAINPSLIVRALIPFANLFDEPSESGA